MVLCGCSMVIGAFRGFGFCCVCYVDFGCVFLIVVV